MSSLKVPENFDFPFPPYDIQKEFMREMYFALEYGKLGIFESPTGTGKSLSIICGAIKWLKDRQALERRHISEKIDQLINDKQKLKTESGDWLSMQSKELEISRQLGLLNLEQAKIVNYEKKIENIKKAKENSLNKYRKKKELNKSDDGDEKLIDLKEENSSLEDKDFLPEEPDYTNESHSSDEENDESKYEPIKIYICSRTHSQLSQLLREIVKSPFGDVVRVTSLASRQTYCINPKVSQLNSVPLINERCLDLQKKPCCQTKKDDNGRVVKKQKKEDTSCPYYRQTVIEELRDQTLMQILDIEDLVSFGKKINACPYYASRKASEDAEVVLIPYNTLLHKATRQATGIKIKNNVVIIDEAHNLMEAIAQMYNVDLTYNQIYHSLGQLKAYRNKFNTKFSASNLLFINQLIYIVTQLEKMIDTSNGTDSDIFLLENFVMTAKIDNYNMFKIVKFCKDSRLAQKIRNYATKYPIDKEPEGKTEKRGLKDFLVSLNPKNAKATIDPTPPVQLIGPSVGNHLLAVIAFLESLTYTYSDGRILFKKHVDKLQAKFQFLLLNPSSNFEDIVKEARSVIVTGGTMKPISEFRNRLFINSGADPSRILEFSCDHIVPPENILPIIVTKGSNNESLLFNFENRMKMAKNLENIILQCCRTVKGGIIVFFPSYNYENWVWQQVKDTNFERPIFREPQSSTLVDAILGKYAAAIRRPCSKGAMLFSVVGGKLSEGLNFSDDLGRCVVVVGLPYANATAADLKEKMKYLDNTEGPGSGQKFYEIQCMKAVNQCIGRAVRHKDDYATVLLLDERFNRTSIKNSLPNWIKRSLKVCEYKQTFHLIDMFFKEK